MPILFIIMQALTIADPTAAIQIMERGHIRLLKAINSIAIRAATQLKGVASSNIMEDSSHNNIMVGSSTMVSNLNITADNNHSIIANHLSHTAIHHPHPEDIVVVDTEAAVEDIVVAAIVVASAEAVDIVVVVGAVMAAEEEDTKTILSIEKIFS
jgi:regulator of RNase E activity RraA